MFSLSSFHLPTPIIPSSSKLHRTSCMQQKIGSITLHDALTVTTMSGARRCITGKRSYIFFGTFLCRTLQQKIIRHFQAMISAQLYDTAEFALQRLDLFLEFGVLGMNLLPKALVLVH